MLIVFKNQFKIIWKKWFSFIGIFILIFLSIILTNSALSASSNLNNVNKSLNQSNMYQYSVDVNNNYFSDDGFNKIADYFFAGASLDYLQKSAIYKNKPITVTTHQDAIEKWNYNFQAWMISEVLRTNYATNKLAVDYYVEMNATINSNSFNLTVANGYNDSNWNFVNSQGIKEDRYNLKTSNLVYLTAGRAPRNDNEVVVSISVQNQNNPNFQIGNIITTSSGKYTIVGRGYNFTSYLNSDDKTTVWMTNSAMNQYWINRDSYSYGKAQYYVNLADYQISGFSFLMKTNYFYFSSYTISNNYDDLKDNLKLKLVSLETILFSSFGIIVFIISIFITVIFLKKDINRQSGSLGILMGLGTESRVLAFNLAIAYLTLLLVPLLIGFGVSFLLQQYLTQLVSKIIFFPFPLVGVFNVPTIISLVIFPLLLIGSLALIIYLLLNKSPLDLIYKRTKIKHHKVRKVKNNSILKKYMDIKITLAFTKNNKLRIFSSLAIFAINFFLILFLFSFINVYNYSSSYFEKNYTSYGNRIFMQRNNTADDLFKAMINNNNFDDNNDKSFHWVSDTDFVAGQRTKYQEVNLANFPLITDWYNTYITPATVQRIAMNPDIIKSEVSTEFYNQLLQMITIWKNNDLYPYITNGFKIYQTNDSLVSTTLSAKWDAASAFSGNNYFNFEGYKNDDFPKWIYYEGDNSQAALNLINQVNNNYLNAILPLAMVEQMHLQIGDIVQSEVNVGYADNQLWAKIPIRLVGVNNYNYFDSRVIVNQNNLMNFIINKYKQLNPTVDITVSGDDIFLNNMLVKDKVPELARNISYYDYSKTYDDFRDLNLNGDFQYYNSISYSDTMINVDQYIGDLIKGLEILISTVLVIAAIVILILIYIVFSENKNNIISLKFLGYNNAKIAKFLLVPYIIGFLSFTLIVTGIVYLILGPILNLLLNASGVLLLFNFSWILWLILFSSIIALILVAITIGVNQIRKSKINDLEMLE